MRHSGTYGFVIAFSLFLLAGCDDSSSGFDLATVTDVRVDPEAVRLGEEIGIQVDFNPSTFTTSGIDDETVSLDNSTVVLRLPAGVEYLNGSSEFDGSDVAGFRERGPNRIEVCVDGTSVLVYNFTPGEQTDNENKIRLSARALSGIGTVEFSADADISISIPCGIIGQDFDFLTILG